MYSSLKDGLSKSWAELMSAEEATRRKCWVDEGRKLERETVSNIMSENARLSELLRAATATIEALRDNTEKEVSRRFEGSIKLLQQEFEIAKIKELGSLKEKLAGYEAQEKQLAILDGYNSVMKEKVAVLEAQKDELNTQLLEITSANTKSSHVIGKIGEATVLDLLENAILPLFPYSQVKDMTSVPHAADFHLWVMSPSGKKIKILIDSKKYKRSINTDEVNKLIIDVDTDESASCGMMISLDSPICSMNQFQIKKTPKMKPIIYISFQNIDDEHRRNILCCAVSTLISFVGEISVLSNTHMDDDIEPFLVNLRNSIKDIDNAIRTQTKAVDMLKQIRSVLAERVESFRKETTIYDVTDDDANDEELVVGKCITIMKSTGEPCGKPVLKGFQKCKSHMGKAGRGGAGQGV
jgi:hypothetical protein